MRLRTTLIWALTGAAMFAGNGHAAGPKELRSTSPGVEVVYEFHPTADFRAFLAAQPPGSISAISIFEPPTKFAVIAKIRLAAPAAQPLRFATTFKLANGATVPQNWRIEQVPPGRIDYKAIFGMPIDVTSASTTIIGK